MIKSFEHKKHNVSIVIRKKMKDYKLNGQNTFFQPLLCALTAKIWIDIKVFIVQDCMGRNGFRLIRLYYLLKKKIQL